MVEKSDECDDWLYKLFPNYIALVNKQLSKVLLVKVLCVSFIKVFLVKFCAIRYITTKLFQSSNKQVDSSPSKNQVFIS